MLIKIQDGTQKGDEHLCDSCEAAHIRIEGTAKVYRCGQIGVRIRRPVTACTQYSSNANQAARRQFSSLALGLHLDSVTGAMVVQDPDDKVIPRAVWNPKDPSGPGEYVPGETDGEGNPSRRVAKYKGRRAANPPGQIQ